MPLFDEKASGSRFSLSQDETAQLEASADFDDPLQTPRRPVQRRLEEESPVLDRNALYTQVSFPSANFSLAHNTLTLLGRPILRLAGATTPRVQTVYRSSTLRRSLVHFTGDTPPPA